MNLDFQYNLDFPIVSKLNSDYIYCTIFDSAMGYIKGFLKISTNNFSISMPNVYLFEKGKYANSEPQIVVIDDKEYLITFTNDDNKSYITLIDIEKGKLEEIEIPTRIPPGFHSIYY